jgi:hypothetical protein
LDSGVLDFHAVHKSPLIYKVNEDSPQQATGYQKEDYFEPARSKLRGIAPKEIEEAGYWRKANAIHPWFVENVQDGNDDCKNYYVSKEDIEALLDTVNTVLNTSELVEGTITNGYRFENSKGIPITEKGKYIKDPTVAQALLPTTEGFFFGSTDYDQYYYQDLVDTKKILENTLEDDEGDYEYQASW